VPDVSVDELNPEELDMVILPGGAGGVEKLKQDPRVERLVKAMEEKGKYISAICAAPTALAKFGILEGKKATVYPTLVEEIKLAVFVDMPVVEDGEGYNQSRTWHCPGVWAKAFGKAGRQREGKGGSQENAREV
jgi:putative intracellular protease/amidase